MKNTQELMAKLNNPLVCTNYEFDEKDVLIRIFEIKAPQKMEIEIYADGTIFEKFWDIRNKENCYINYYENILEEELNELAERHNNFKCN